MASSTRRVDSQPTAQGAMPTPDSADLRLARQLALERRLEDGYRRIEEARLHGADVRAWEDFWCQLLREYEAVCDEIGTLAA